MPQFAATALAALGGVALAVLYTLVAQRVFRARRFANHLDVMSRAFLLGVPFALGVVAICGVAGWRRVTVAEAVVLPSLAVLILVGLTLALRWEALIAVVMALPLCLITASLGGVVGLLLVSVGWPGPLRAGLVGLILLGPYFLALLECRRRSPNSYRGREEAITIAADQATIWRNIIRVPPISPHEQRVSLFALAGVPRPREATLSHEGLGGIRTGHFDHGITFHETIVEWCNEEVLRFDLAVQHAAAVRTPLSAIGGPYFDILEVTYRLEPLHDGRTILHLASRERVTTRFNGYAGLWLDAIMRDFQRSILRIVKARCECQESSILPRPH